MDLTYIDFATLVMEDHAGERATQREGQHAFNCLFMNRPDLSEQIRGTILDPYYRDEHLPQFWIWVEAHWDDENTETRSPDEIRRDLIQKAIDASRGEDVF
jgi:hypothetical protein